MADTLIPHNQSNLLLGISGGTGSGKTTLTRKIRAALPEQTALIQHDWYYHDRSNIPCEQRLLLNYDEPSALDNALLIDHLKRLQRGDCAECPRYDFANHIRLPDRIPLDPRRIILVEGILLFAVPGLRELFDLLLYVDTDDDIRLMRRIKRDLNERGRDLRSIEEQYYRTVRPMHHLHVAQSRQYAHLIVPEGGDNAEALDVIAGRLELLVLNHVDARVPASP